MAKKEVSLLGKDILDISSLTRDEIDLILNTALKMKRIMKSGCKKIDALRGKSVITLFYEASTRTRTSFESAGKYLGADVVNINTASSSVTKGECLKDTILVLENMDCDAVVMRTPLEGAAVYAAKVGKPVIINAGDGAHAHPSQALLDLFTLCEKGLKDLQGKKITIVGDILYSRVARSNIAMWKKFDADIHVCGPMTLLPHDIETLGVKVDKNIEDALRDAEVVDVLRIQLERQKHGLFPSAREYSRQYGVNDERLKLCKPNVVVLHPGPMNRGLEISYGVGYSDNAAIRTQVNNGVAVRMALLYLTLNGGETVENIN
ncbi:MAG: aspartate carbamoyltransferase catalytic subunit [Phascolarctobacterium sp.]|nr:aspartate carbamoyltransferase catalytic subunit [Candidatus Phascolarctobacterium caballi]